MKRKKKAWGTPVERERRNRIRISVWAYAYEVMDDPLVSDARYDKVSRRIEPNVVTGHPKLDKFFKKHFSPDTGMWVRVHPDKAKLHSLYLRYKMWTDQAPTPPTRKRLKVPSKATKGPLRRIALKRPKR